MRQPHASLRGTLRDRTEAGCLLAEKLSDFADRSDVIVLGLPRGGVPVAAEIAKALGAPLDVCLVRKLGVPGNEELAMGAIGLGGTMVLNDRLIQSLKVSETAIAQTITREIRELARRDLVYRGERPFPEIRDRTVILVDDGIATGSTVAAAMSSLQGREPTAIIVAAPVIPPDAIAQLQERANRVVSLLQPDPFHFLGYWYGDFSPTSDEEVCALLAQSPAVG
ncbi:phosphoribosyltransferase [Oscillatoria sp. FACHB-1406]|uniref:phosphoribosyltransferase n=1 Tax=Oscillatoria sp. FACHB-1406 TaxID=2692846 RepID=UPI00168394D9|nr:phosphoribosyltransferase [Oscillatoria sp. FACHB-1406]MBD2576393.1 phosphoribosyltransferase [Oscillatoria sp. FACHB-1406]